jgi:hypothetical protein
MRLDRLSVYPEFVSCTSFCALFLRTRAPRKALLSVFQSGTPCPCYGKPVRGLLMELDHETDSAGRRTGRYLGFSDPACNQSVNAFNNSAAVLALIPLSRLSR